MFKKIKQAIADHKESIELERRMDAALIDHGFLTRASLGLTTTITDKWDELDKLFRGNAA